MEWEERSFNCKGNEEAKEEPILAGVVDLDVRESCDIK